tara:strand:- start:232 stop:912 length:681 start_codon:yes stop_codon:yes gene_type:complete
MLNQSCSPPLEEVEKLTSTVRFFKKQKPLKIPDYYLHNLSHVTIDGMWLEFGVWVGTSINLIANIMHHMNKGYKTVYGFDSFEGLPEDWVDPETGSVQDEGKKGHFNLHGRFPNKQFDNIEFVKGWFDESLPSFLKDKGDQKIALLHIDSDLYSSANTIFENLSDRIVPGTVIMFDEFYNYKGFEAHEYKAFKEFADKHRVSYEWISHVAPPGRQATMVIRSIENG